MKFFIFTLIKLIVKNVFRIEKTKLDINIRLIN